MKHYWIILGILVLGISLSSCQTNSSAEFLLRYEAVIKTNETLYAQYETSMQTFQIFIKQERNPAALIELLNEETKLAERYRPCTFSFEDMQKRLVEVVKKDQLDANTLAVLRRDLKNGQEVLQTYLDFIAERYPDQLSAVAKEWQKDSCFLEKHLANLPVHASLLQLSLIQNELLKLHYQTSKTMRAEALEHYDSSTKMELVLAEDHNKVHLGEDYKARLRLRFIHAPDNIEMTMNGKPVTIENGVGKLRVKAEGAGQKEVPFQLKLNYYGKDTTWSGTAHYEVIPKK